MNKPSLYNLTTEYQQLLNGLFDPDTGEISEEVEYQLARLEDTLEKKCIAIGGFIKSLDAEKAELENLKSEIAKREAAYDKLTDKMQRYLQVNMELCGITQIRSPYFTIKIKKNRHSTDIIDESLIPKEFINIREIVKTETKADKEAIKRKVLETGVQIPGAHVHQKTKLEILTDTI